MNSWRVLLLVFIPGLLGMRDPFQIPEDKCSVSQLAMWHYRGMADFGGLVTGIVQDAEGKWHRLRPGQQLENRWTVSGITLEQIDLTLNAECEPSQWRWVKEGTNHDSKDTARAAVPDDSRHSERKNRHAGG
ncbi:HofP DNA utilization family protein [Scandinavium sp. NPDC088450]|uniref:HofP DNA utilization family protein n=1 Tax=Scandinavium sp. NPDC088450 TaxID=3364514 RepID=UPI00385048D2